MFPSSSMTLNWKQPGVVFVVKKIKSLPDNVAFIFNEIKLGATWRCSLRHQWHQIGSNLMMLSLSSMASNWEQPSDVAFIFNEIKFEATWRCSLRYQWHQVGSNLMMLSLSSIASNWEQPSDVAFIFNEIKLEATWQCSLRHQWHQIGSNLTMLSLSWKKLNSSLIMLHLFLIKSN